ncbi:phosphoribosyltransferase [Pseudomonas japonica]|uniref:phosphoribosyltransferase n=1 Tax=Pseudomonas japonica TaxID=256466 RepID=UPI003A89D32D
MLALVTSPDAFRENGTYSRSRLKAFGEIAKNLVPVYVVSNHDLAPNIKQAFIDEGLKFIFTSARQGGQVIAQISKELVIKSHDILVFAVKLEDMQMAKNGRAVLIADEHAIDRRVSGLGIKVKDLCELKQVIEICKGWTGSWWYRGQGKLYQLRVLANLSSKYVQADQAAFARMLTNTVKNGGAKLTALLAVVSRSLLNDTVIEGDLLWGCYPSSSSSNKDEDVLSDFTHRLRTTVSSVHYAKRDEPLFIRHRPSIKRSTSIVNRADPKDQITSLHLNPRYKKQISKRRVIIIDDCTTYGASFAVAAGFLRAAGAEDVVGLALGKFGNCLADTSIEIKTCPFEPVAEDGYSFSIGMFECELSVDAQHVLLELLAD